MAAISTGLPLAPRHDQERELERRDAGAEEQHPPAAETREQPVAPPHDRDFEDGAERERDADAGRAHPKVVEEVAGERVGAGAREVEDEREGR